MKNSNILTGLYSSSFWTFLLISLFTFRFIGCKTDPKIKAPAEAISVKSSAVASRQSAYPLALTAIFDVHGGLTLWKNKRTLIYDLPKADYTENHTIDLHRRTDRIDAKPFSMGFDGTQTWILDPDGDYGGNPEFYHNLMFYFYAMPFVLADPGIVYGETPDLEFQGRSYPGMSITYNDGVGTSPEDEYYIHYDPQSGRMAWLGYTVTYRSGQKSENVKWIRYDDWEIFGGLLLPRSISWYNYTGRTIEDLRNTVRFENIRISELATDPVRFEKPEGAVIFQPE